MRERIMIRITSAPRMPPAIFGTREEVELELVALEGGVVLKGELGGTLKMS